MEKELLFLTMDTGKVASQQFFYPQTFLIQILLIGAMVGTMGGAIFWPLSRTMEYGLRVTLGVLLGFAVWVIFNGTVISTNLMNMVINVLEKPSSNNFFSFLIASRGVLQFMGIGSMLILMFSYPKQTGKGMIIGASIGCIIGIAMVFSTPHLNSIIPIRILLSSIIITIIGIITFLSR